MDSGTSDGSFQERILPRVSRTFALTIPQLPRGIDPPVVGKFDPDAIPILYIAVTSDRPVRETTELADKRVRRQIESIPGVGQVNLLGGRKRQVNVWLDPVKLAALTTAQFALAK